jgi:hypothetical protein
MTLAQLHYAALDESEDTRPLAPVGRVSGLAALNGGRR